MSDFIINSEIENEIDNISPETMNVIGEAMEKSIENFRARYKHDIENVLEDKIYSNENISLEEKSNLVNNLFKSVLSYSSNDIMEDTRIIGNRIGLDNESLEKLNTSLIGLSNMSRSIEDTFNEAKDINDNTFSIFKEKEKEKEKDINFEPDFNLKYDFEKDNSFSL